jgi:hypothetical protein
MAADRYRVPMDLTTQACIVGGNHKSQKGSSRYRNQSPGGIAFAGLVGFRTAPSLTRNNEKERHIRLQKAFRLTTCIN